MPVNHPVFDAEIDLNDYLDVILKKKRIIIIVFCVIFLFGTLVNVLTPTKKYFQVTAIFENPRIENIGGQGEKIKIKVKEIMNLEESIIIIRSDPFVRTLFDNTNPKIAPEEIQSIIQNDIGFSKIFGTYFFKLEVNSKDPKKALAIAQEILKKFEPVANDAMKKYSLNFKNGDLSISKFRIIDPPAMPDQITKIVPNKKLRTILLLLMAGFFALWSPFIAEFFDRRKHRHISLPTKNIEK